MGEAIGQMLPAAVGVAISPLPIVAVVLMLVTPRGRLNGPAFLVGWIVGLAVVGVVVLSVAGGANASEDGAPADWVAWLKLVLGILLLLLAAKQWRGRPRAGPEAEAPKWLSALDTFTPGKALGAGAVLSGANPKNLLLAVGGAAAIAQTGISAGQETVVWVVFVVIASLGVGTPVVLSIALGDRSRRMLDELKTWMSAHNAAIMAVLLLVLGVKLLGDGISGLSA
jgi:threonine/homoserine/homoserine lactone efflux protein